MRSSSLKSSKTNSALPVKRSVHSRGRAYTPPALRPPLLRLPLLRPPLEPLPLQPSLRKQGQEEHPRRTLRGGKQSRRAPSPPARLIGSPPPPRPQVRWGEPRLTPREVPPGRARTLGRAHTLGRARTPSPVSTADESALTPSTQLSGSLPPLRRLAKRNKSRISSLTGSMNSSTMSSKVSRPSSRIRHQAPLERERRSSARSLGRGGLST